MIDYFEHMFPFLISLIFDFCICLLIVLVLSVFYYLTDNLTNYWCELKPVAWTACAYKDFLRLANPIDDKIVGFCVCIKALLNIFYSNKILSKILQSFFSQYFIIKINRILYCIWIGRLMRSMLRKLYTKLFSSIARHWVKHLTLFGKMSKWRIFSD